MAERDMQRNPNQYRPRRRMPRYEINDRQSFVDILGTVLRYVLIIVLILVIIRASTDAYRFGYEVFSNEAMAEAGQGQEVSVTITGDMSDSDVGTLLQEDGLIKDARVFPLQVRLSSEGSIQPGTYTLSTEMTTDEILKTLTEGSDSTADTGATTYTGSTASSDTTDGGSQSSSQEGSSAAVPDSTSENESAQ